MTEFLEWLDSSAPAQWIKNTPGAFPLVEVVHVVAIALVFGSIAFVDLRLIGITSNRRPVSRLASELLRWTWIAFAAAVLSGLTLFLQRPMDYFLNTSFRIKMILLALAGLNMLLFELLTARSMRDWDRDVAPPVAARVAGVLSLGLWIGVIIAGRLIGFTIQGFNTPPAEFDINDLLGSLPLD